MLLKDRAPSARRSSAGNDVDAGVDPIEGLDLSAHGQAVTRRALAALCDRGWMHLGDLHWPGRPRAVIDHVAVGPGGIIVLTTVHWIGVVELRAGKIWHNSRPSAAQHTCEVAAAAIRSVLPHNLHDHVVPALSVVTRQSLDAVAGSVVTTSATNLETVLNRRAKVLDDDQVARTAAVLWATLSAGAGGRHQSTRASAGGGITQIVTWWRSLLLGSGGGSRS